jgi:uncharacterized protein YdhG (YjbR/CyaY superfamily)
MQSKAATVADYLASLPADRRAAIQTVRKVIRDNLDPTYQEAMQYGMIGYSVPHSVFPAGYHCDPKQPLPFAALASQKNHMAVYLMCGYGNPEYKEWFESAWARSGKKYDAGKSCIRFQSPDDLALDVLGDAIRRVPARTFIANYQQALVGAKAVPRKAAAKKPAAKRATPAAGPKKTARKKTGKRVARRG